MESFSMAVQHPILQILIQNKCALLKIGIKNLEFDLNKKPLLWGVNKLACNVENMRSIILRMEDLSFSGTREAIAVVNTIAWALGIKINGQSQLKPAYRFKPNITKSSK